MRRPGMFFYVSSFPLISSVLHHKECIVFHFFYSASLMLLSLCLHSFIFSLFLFPVALFLSTPSIPHLSLSLYLRLSSPFSTNARERALAIKAIMSMFAKALIHQNKERQRERERRMDDKGERENKREGGRRWSVPLNGFGL